MPLLQAIGLTSLVNEPGAQTLLLPLGGPVLLRGQLLPGSASSMLSSVCPSQ